MPAINRAQRLREATVYHKDLSLLVTLADRAGHLPEGSVRTVSYGGRDYSSAELRGLCPLAFPLPPWNQADWEAERRKRDDRQTRAAGTTVGARPGGGGRFGSVTLASLKPK